MNKSNKHIVRGFSLPVHLLKWLIAEAKRENITSVSNFLAIIIADEKKRRDEDRN